VSQPNVTASDVRNFFLTSIRVGQDVSPDRTKMRLYRKIGEPINGQPSLPNMQTINHSVAELRIIVVVLHIFCEISILKPSAKAEQFLR